MKKIYSTFFILFIVIIIVHAQTPIKILDFYLGMSKVEVKTLCAKMKAVPVAQYVSFEAGRNHDQIKIDNEFSSVNNKIDILYNDEGKVKTIIFQYKVVDILLNASDLDPAKLAEKLSQDLGISGFKENILSFGVGFEYTENNFKISIDSKKNIKLVAL